MPSESLSTEFGFKICKLSPCLCWRNTENSSIQNITFPNPRLKIPILSISNRSIAKEGASFFFLVGAQGDQNTFYYFY